MSVITEKQSKTKLDEVLGQHHILILHNDDHNTFDWVINCLINHCNHELEQATQCAYIVHYNGKCDVKRGNEELIKKCYNKLKSAGLTVTMEEN